LGTFGAGLFDGQVEDTFLFISRFVKYGLIGGGLIRVAYHLISGFWLS
jgi:hypothetical protein